MLISRFGYVSVSRASHDVTVFADDYARLGHMLGAQLSKTSARRVCSPYSDNSSYRQCALTMHDTDSSAEDGPLR